MRDYITYVCIFIALILALCYLILTAPIWLLIVICGLCFVSGLANCA